MHLSIGIDRDKRVPSAWQAELDRFFPRSDCLSWLYLDWLSDDKGDEIGRWVIYQMVPAQYVMPEMLVALKGPHPDLCGYWKRVGSVSKWVSTAPPGLTSRKWELWRQHRCEARLFWVIQGSGGGHKYRITDITEIKTRRMLGIKPDTPAPGALPYADFDWRVCDNLLDLDQVRVYYNVSDLLSRKPGDFDRDERKAAEDARWALRKWWMRQVDEMVEDVGMHWWARNRQDFPYSGDASIRNEDIELEQFITDAPYQAAS